MAKHSPVLLWTFSSSVTLPKVLMPLSTSITPTWVHPLLPSMLVFLTLTGFQPVNQWIDLEGQRSVLGSAKDPFSFHKQPPTPSPLPASINISDQLLLTSSDSFNTLARTHLPAHPLSQWEEVSVLTVLTLVSYRWDKHDQRANNTFFKNNLVVVQ